MKKNNTLRTMLGMVRLLKKLVPIEILAIIIGTSGFILSLNVTLFGVVGVMKLLGESVPLSLPVIMIICITSGLLRGVLRYGEQYLNHFLAFKTLALIRHKVFLKIRQTFFDYQEEQKEADLMQLISADVEMMEIFYAHTISPLFIAIAYSSLLIWVLVKFVDPLFALVLGVAHILVGVCFPLFFHKLIQKDRIKYKETLVSFSGEYLDDLKGMQDIVIQGQVDNTAKRIDEYSKVLNNHNMRVDRKAGILTPLFALVITLAGLVAIILGYTQNIPFTTTLLGTIIILSSFGGVLALANLPLSLSQSLPSARRVLELLEKEPVFKENTKGSTINFESLSVKKVTHAYDKESLFKPISFDAKVGEIVGIQGVSGIGKTTLLHIIMGVLEPTVGHVFINDVNLKEINTKSLRNNVVLFSQQTKMFNMSIKENLLIGNPHASDAMLEEALRSVKMEDRLATMEGGINYIINDSATNLSSGEIQRLGLARILLSPAKLVLFDEPTSHLDSMSEAIILKTILKEKDKRCFLMVSHRLSTLSICDQIISLT